MSDILYPNEIVRALDGETSGPKDFESKRLFVSLQMDLRTKPLHEKIEKLERELSEAKIEIEGWQSEALKWGTEFSEAKKELSESREREEAKQDDFAIKFAHWIMVRFNTIGEGCFMNQDTGKNFTNEEHIALFRSSQTSK